MHFLRLSKPSRRPVSMSVIRNANLQDFQIRTSTSDIPDSKLDIYGIEFPQDKTKRAVGIQAINTYLKRV